MLGGVLGQMGGGDIKYTTALGVWLGWPNITHVLILGFIIGAVWGAIKLFWLKVLRPRINTFTNGLLSDAFKVKAPLILSRLPNDPKIIPDNAVPLGACLGISLWFFGGLLMI